MRVFHKEFYATRQDQLPNLHRLVSEVKLQYVLAGMFECAKPSVYTPGQSFPILAASRTAATTTLRVYAP